MLCTENNFVVYKEFTADNEEDDYSGENVSNALVKIEWSCNFTCAYFKERNNKGSESMTQKYYEKEFKRNIVRRHIEEGQTIKSLAEEYGVSKTSIKIWCKEFIEECQNKAKKVFLLQSVVFRTLP